MLTTILILMVGLALADRWWGGRSAIAPWWPFEWSSNPEAVTIAGFTGLLAFWSPWGLLVAPVFLLYRIDGQAPNRWTEWLGLYREGYIPGLYSDGKGVSYEVWHLVVGNSLQSVWAGLAIGIGAYAFSGDPLWALLTLTRGLVYYPMNNDRGLKGADWLAELGSGAILGLAIGLAA